jgi:hypothetical protein
MKEDGRQTMERRIEAMIDIAPKSTLVLSHRSLRD